MNSRSSVNESNLVNLSGDLSTLNQLDTKESLALSFPFDHLYACHSESSDSLRPQSLDKEVEISSLADDKNLASTSEPSLEVSRLSERLTAAETQNKRLKNLLLLHLDLIQQQNELISNKDKLNSQLRLENDSLKSRVNRMDRRITVGQKHNINPLPLAHVSPSTVTSNVKKEPSSTGSQQTTPNTISEFLMPESRTNRKHPYIFKNEIPKIKPFVPEKFDLNRTPKAGVTSYLPGDISAPPILDTGNLQRDNFGTMIDNKRSYIKKEIKTEPRPEPLYTVTSNSGNTVIQKIQRSRRRTSGGIGSLSRLPKTQAVKVEPPENVNMFEDDKAFERNFSVNKKSKMINTYGKSKTSTIPKRSPLYTGSLSDRLQLIDTTPTGEDPYQLGEADMREQSPIPKLMLQKTNHGRLKICSDLMGETSLPSRRIYDAPATETSTKMPNKIRLEKRYNLPNIIPYTVSKTSTLTSTLTSTNTAANAYSSIHLTTHTTTHATTHTTTLTTPRTSTHTASYKALHTASHKTLHTALHKTPHTPRHRAPHSALHKAPHTTFAKVQHPVPYTSTTTHITTNTTSKIVKDEFTIPTSPLQTPLQLTNVEPLKKDLEVDWLSFTTSRPTGTEKSMCDFSYGENPNLTTLPPIDDFEFRQLMEEDPPTSSLNIMNALPYTTEKNVSDKTKRRGVRTTSLLPPSLINEQTGEVVRGTETKRGRKRALSTAGLIKNTKENFPKPVGPRPKMVRGRGNSSACRGKKPSVPGMTTRKPYHTLVGDPDLSWYLGLDPDVKMEDIDQSGDCKASTVEVPRWRELPCSSSYSVEGTENLDDKVFEKRHQKLEAEERRQLRWHMRRIREQRHIERLRMRQRDPWYSGHSPYQPSMYTIWPQPQRDVRMIEITDTIPVMAFGENLPDLPRAAFMLPWVRTSKALKRSKRSKTLH